MSNWRQELEVLYRDNKIQTDSDLVDFADERNLSRKDVDNYAGQIRAAGTPCFGCAHVSLHGMYPCNQCCRGKQDMFELSEDLISVRAESIKNLTSDRKGRKETVSCYLYVTTTAKQQTCHITDVPVIKKVIELAERNGCKKWTFCDTVEGSYDLNRDWIEIGPVECGIEYSGAYPVDWDSRDAAILDILEDNGQIFIQVFQVKEDGSWVPNH